MASDNFESSRHFGLLIIKEYIGTLNEYHIFGYVLELMEYIINDFSHFFGRTWTLFVCFRLSSCIQHLIDCLLGE